MADYRPAKIFQTPVDEDKSYFYYGSHTRCIGRLMDGLEISPSGVPHARFGKITEVVAPKHFIGVVPDPHDRGSEKRNFRPLRYNELVNMQRYLDECDLRALPTPEVGDRYMGIWASPGGGVMIGWGVVTEVLVYPDITIMYIVEPVSEQKMIRELRRRDKARRRMMAGKNPRGNVLQRVVKEIFCI